MTMTLVPDFEADEDATVWLFARPRTRTPSEAVARFDVVQTANTAGPDAQPTRRHPVHPAAPPNVSEFINVRAIDAVIDDLDERFHVLGSDPHREDVFYVLQNFIGYAHNRNGFDLDADTMAAVLTSYGAIWNYVHIDRADLRPTTKTNIHNRLVAAACRVLHAQGTSKRGASVRPGGGGRYGQVGPSRALLERRVGAHSRVVDLSRHSALPRQRDSDFGTWCRCGTFPRRDDGSDLR